MSNYRFKVPLGRNTPAAGLAQFAFGYKTQSIRLEHVGNAPVERVYKAFDMLLGPEKPDYPFQFVAKDNGTQLWLVFENGMVNMDAIADKCGPVVRSAMLAAIGKALNGEKTMDSGPGTNVAGAGSEPKDGTSRAAGDPSEGDRG